MNLTKQQRGVLLTVAVVCALIYLTVARIKPGSSLAETVLGGEPKDSVLERVTGDSLKVFGTVLALILLRLPPPVALAGAGVAIAVTSLGRVIRRVVENRERGGPDFDSLCAGHGGVARIVSNGTGAICQDGTLVARAGKP